ncbi:TonB-dependent siderophore receptor [Gilvimarinus algae]|uniref:TonB-dependent siderophore receptor n=1 Tax=Gilvimarinus algae TaxID=3058037 RepID=A0ABT8THR4_9GAMM|nr:TonB-dependent siderophore receptor [Gilvimarinus sp. SDUM040014]MDO3383642.1 TonB-dependent siderophore receptor [Gilvimarinus sp. SDUM040014]
MTVFRHPLAAAILAVVSCSAPFVYAADTAENDNEALPTINVRGVADSSDAYTVGSASTATGLGLSARETPQSMTVVTRQMIEDMNLESLTDVVNSVTGVSARELDSSRQSFSARGFSIDNVQIDGVPMTYSSGWSAGETQSSTVIYDRVEVVRGATGLMTGAGNPSAAINLVRKHAVDKELTGKTSLRLGRWNSVQGELDVTTPLNRSGSVRARVAASYKEADSYIDWREEKTGVFYGIVDADLTDSTRLSVGASYQDNEPTASSWGGLPVWYSDGTRTDWPRSKNIGTKWTSWASTNTTYFAHLLHQFDNQWIAELRYDHNENDGKLNLLYTSGTVDKETGLGLSPSISRYDNTREQDNMTLRVNGPLSLFGREHELGAGVVRTDQNFVANRYNRGEQADIGNFFEWDGNYPQPQWLGSYEYDKRDTVETAAYVVSRWSLADPLKLILGARYSDWDAEGFDWRGPYEYGNDNVITPYAGLVYDFAEHYTAYVSYTEIFNPQNSKDANGDLLDPVEGANYEAGIKAEFYDGQLNLAAAVFRIEQDNVAQADGDNLVPGTDDQAYYGAQGVVSDGYELEASGELAPGWSLSVGWSSFTAEDADGNPVNTNQPRKLLNLFTKYELDAWVNGLSIGAGVNWEDENYTDATNPVTGDAERLTQEAFTLVRLMANYEFSDQLSVQFNINNALDETYYSQIGFYSQLAYGAPRDYELSLNYRF